MATSTVNLRALLEEVEEKHQLGDGFKASSEKNNGNMQKNIRHSDISGAKQDYDIEFLASLEEQYALEEERNQRRITKKKVVKKKKVNSELDEPPLPIIKEKELPMVSNQIPVSSFSKPNKQQLREAILWAEVLGEPKCRKRHRR